MLVATIAALVLAFTPPPALAAASNTGRASLDRELSADVPAAGVEIVRLIGHDGEVAIEVGDTEHIRIRVHIKSKRKGLMRSSSRGDAYVEDARLETSMRGGRLQVELSGGRGREEVTETWTVVVPARLAVEVRMAAARIAIVGVAGGVGVKLGTGDLKVDVPRGAIDADVTVGNVEVNTRTDSHGEVDLRSRVGDTDLWLDGSRIDYPNPPGPGSRVSIRGSGRDRIKVSVMVGDADLRLGTRR